MNASLMKGNRRGDATDSASDDPDIKFGYGVDSSIEIIFVSGDPFEALLRCLSNGRGCTQSVETDCDYLGRVHFAGPLKREHEPE